MRIVCDTSIVIATLLNEDNRDVIISLTKGCDLVSPESLISEVGNAFTAMFKRKQIDIKNALVAIDEFKKMKIQFMEIDLSNSIRIANDLDIYAYDAYMIDLAQRLKCSLFTLDSLLNQRAKEFGIKTMEK